MRPERRLFERELRFFGGERLVAVYEANYDHSITGEGPTQTITLAVVVAPATVWTRCEGAWAKAMKRGGAEGRILHMKELVHGVGAFPDFKDVRKQTELLKRLVPVVREHVSWGFCASLALPWWQHMHKPALVEGHVP